MRESAFESMRLYRNRYGGDKPRAIGELILQQPLHTFLVHRVPYWYEEKLDCFEIALCGRKRHQPVFGFGPFARQKFQHRGRSSGRPATGPRCAVMKSAYWPTPRHGDPGQHGAALIGHLAVDFRRLRPRGITVQKKDQRESTDIPDDAPHHILLVHGPQVTRGPTQRRAGLSSS